MRKIAEATVGASIAGIGMYLLGMDMAMVISCVIGGAFTAVALS